MYATFFLSEYFFRHLAQRVWITKVLLYEKCMYACMYVHSTLATNIPMYRHTYTYTCMYVRTCKYLHTCHTYVVYTYTYQAIIFLISFLTFIHYFFYFLFDTLQLLIQLTALVLQNTSSEQH